MELEGGFHAGSGVIVAMKNRYELISAMSTVVMTQMMVVA
ncbi:hypothetical protein CGZ88_1207 [Bifidobacterium anseris]|uniref:Uncharacterized protein n=1 Tax=Bifidobacterium anseris TaxID=2020963 RepID=A0A2N5IXP1_9BIFI|nr:hypothetical protein CGZ88_1207 [Bifidobacterium anseris]